MQACLGKAARASVILWNLCQSRVSVWVGIEYGLPLSNGSRLSCGRPLAGARVVDESPCPPEHKHSVSLKAITARQLQALVRRHAWPCWFQLCSRLGKWE